MAGMTNAHSSPDSTDNQQLQLHRSYVTVIYGTHDTISMLYGMMYCGKLTGEDLSRHLNKIESVGLRKAYR